MHERSGETDFLAPKKNQPSASFYGAWFVFDADIVVFFIHASVVVALAEGHTSPLNDRPRPCMD